MIRRLLIPLFCLSLLLSACLPDAIPSPTDAIVTIPAENTLVAATAAATDTPAAIKATPLADVKPSETPKATTAPKATETPAKGVTQPVAASPTAPGPTITPNPAFTAIVTRAVTATNTPEEPVGNTPTPYLTATLGPTVNPALQVVIVPFNVGSWVISNYGLFEADGSHILTGEVQNNDSSAQGSVIVTALMYDSKGSEISTTSSPPLMEVVPSKGKTSFRLTAIQWDNVRSVMLQVTGIAAGPARQDLKVTNQKATPSSGNVKVEGSVQNTGSSAASSVQVIVTIYDNSGKVLDCAASPTNPDTLAANATAAYSVTLNHMDGYDHFAVQVEGH